MAANLADHQPIRCVKTISGNSPATRAIGELAGQTFLSGTPLQVAASGFLQAWDGATLVKGIAGISKLDGSNYGSNAAGAPGVFGAVGFPGTLVTFGKVPFQASAKNIPHGAPIADGRNLIELAVADNLFEAQLDNGAAGAFASLQNQIGAIFGMTIDATGHWYVDLNKAGTATLIIQAFNPNDAIGTNAARAWFSFLDSQSQLIS